MTAQDIREVQFPRKHNGYDAASVDVFLEDAAKALDEAQRENAVLKSKMKVLVEKIEEYRATEDSMRLTLLAAKKTADEMTEKARTESEALLTDAKTKSNEMISKAEAEYADKMYNVEKAVRDEEKKLGEAKVKVEQYLKDMTRQLKACAEAIKNINNVNDAVPDYVEPVVEQKPVQSVESMPVVNAAPVKIEEDLPEEPKEEQEPKTPDYMQSLFESAEKNIQEVNDTDAFGDTQMFRLDEKHSWDEVEEPTSPHPKFDFSDLRFGNNYFGEDD